MHTMMLQVDAIQAGLSMLTGSMHLPNNPHLCIYRLQDLLQTFHLIVVNEFDRPLHGCTSAE